MTATRTIAPVTNNNNDNDDSNLNHNCFGQRAAAVHVTVTEFTMAVTDSRLSKLWPSLTVAYISPHSSSAVVVGYMPYDAAVSH